MFEITGDRTGRRWRCHITADRLEAPGWGDRYRMTDVADGSGAYYHEYVKSDDYAAEVARMRTAIEVATLPHVAESPFIVQNPDDDRSRRRGRRQCGAGPRRAARTRLDSP